MIPLVAAVPVEPDPDTARELLLQELAKQEYQALQPTWFDRLSQAVGDWLGSLVGSVAGAPGWLTATVGAVLLAIVIGGALLLFGAPRLRARRTPASVALFGDDDTRSATELRRAAADAAAAGDWDLAIQERYRALARGLDERAVVDLHPGTTARAVALLAATARPDAAAAVGAAADRFDGVRYLGATGDETGYRAVVEADDALRGRVGVRA